MLMRAPWLGYLAANVAYRAISWPGKGAIISHQCHGQRQIIGGAAVKNSGRIEMTDTDDYRFTHTGSLADQLNLTGLHNLRRAGAVGRRPTRSGQDHRRGQGSSRLPILRSVR